MRTLAPDCAAIRIWSFPCRSGLSSDQCNPWTEWGTVISCSGLHAAEQVRSQVDVEHRQPRRRYLMSRLLVAALKLSWPGHRDQERNTAATVTYDRLV